MKYFIRQKTSGGTVNVKLMEKIKNADSKWVRRRLHPEFMNRFASLIHEQI